MFGQLALLVAAGLLGPLLAAGRRPLAPVLVGELVAGALLGKTGLGVLDPAANPFPAFSSIGFAMLMLNAGSEIDFRSPELRGGIARGAIAFGITVGAGILPALLISGALAAGHSQLLVVLLVGSSAAVAFPIIQERGLTGPAVVLLIGWIALADFVTALVMPLTLVGPGKILPALLGDVVIVLICAAFILGGERLLTRPAAAEAARESIRRGWALQLRISLLLLLVLAAIAERSGGSLLVAGFAAGIVLRRLNQPDRVALQLSGLANGFFVPAFFVLLGATLNLRDLFTDWSALILAPAMALAATAVHLLGAAVAAPQHRLATGLAASAQLGLPAAAASLGLAEHVLSPAIAAGLVAGGVLTLIPATIGGTLLARGQGASASAATKRRRS